MAEQRQIRLTINGQERTGQVEARVLLVDFVREELGLNWDTCRL